MSDYSRPRLTWGNDFTINIELQQFYNGDYVDFNINTVKSLEVYLICSTHNQKIPLEWELEPGFDNIISCFVDYRVTHPNTSYGIGVEGIDEYDKHFRWYMLPKEGILLINNTSGQNVPQDVEVVDLIGRVGFGVQTDADLTNYYTKIEANTLLDEKADESELADKQDTLVSGTNIKTINSQSLLGSGNMIIEGTEQLQADWTQTDTSAKDYIKHKPTIPAAQVQSDWNETNTTAVDYIKNKPTIPAAQVQSDWNETNTTAVDYIKNKPTIPAAQVNSDWNATSGVAKILNKPDLNNYATKTDLNNYYDKGETDGLLNNKVDVSTLNSDYYNKNTVNNLLDAKADNSDLNNYYDKQETNTLLNQKADNSDLNNYYDKQETNTLLSQKASVSDLNNKQDTLVSGTNIKTINNISVLGSGNIDIDAENNDEVTANALYDINGRLTETEITVKTIPQYIEANIVPVNERIDGVYNDLSDMTDEIDNTNFANSLILTELHNEIDDKQDELVSGTNIKTVNGTSLLGSGDITVGGSSDPIYYIDIDWQLWPQDPTWQGSQAIYFKSVTVYDLTTGTQAYYGVPGSSKSLSVIFSEISSQLGIRLNIYIDNIQTDISNFTFRTFNYSYYLMDIPQTFTNKQYGNGSVIVMRFYEWDSTAFKVKNYCNNIVIPIGPGQHRMVTSTTSGLKIETVSSAPSGTVPVTLAFDSTTNTLYLVQ